MDLLHNLALGFGTALTLQNGLYCFLGCLLGTAIGVLPGIGPVPTIAMLLPITYSLSPTTALIMLAGIYYGAQYGGSTTSILVNLPGESSSVVTCLDGYQMARRGRAGAALTISALGSFFAGCVATVVIAAFAPALAEVAFQFGPAEYFSLLVVGMLGAVMLAHGSALKAVAMIVLGVLLGLVGTDVNSGVERFSLGVPELADGINFVVVAMGLFAFSEIIKNLEQTGEEREVFTENVKDMWLTKEEVREAVPAVLRGTILGSILGILPGGGAVVASFAAYAFEKKVSKTPERFGKGAIAGVASPESANNAAAQTSFIPMLVLGLPANATMALMVGAMMIHNIQPGPQVMTSNPALFWGLICSMWIGNVMLLVLNLPLIGMWIKMLKLPYRFMFPAILLFCAIGVYSLQNNVVDVLLTIPFGVLGYFFDKLECEPAPLLLGFILGPMLEENLTRAMLIARGSVSIFYTRPLSLALLVVAGALLFLMIVPAVRKKRAEVFAEEN
ncbi:MAG: tripartite tricarboxylate transporter permease [Myxococcales bacterium]